MFTLTQPAKTELENYFADNDPSTIRIYLAPGGCSGPMLSLALDEAGDDDAVFTEDSFTFCINKELLEKTGELTLDIQYEGFVVIPTNSLGGGGGGCSGCGCSGGGCSQ